MRPDRESKPSKEEGVSRVRMRRPLALAIASASCIANAQLNPFVRVCLADSHPKNRKIMSIISRRQVQGPCALLLLDYQRMSQLRRLLHVFGADRFGLAFVQNLLE